MPGGNGTGPTGTGAGTGRHAGFCAGYGTPGYANNTGRESRGAGFSERGRRNFRFRRFFSEWSFRGQGCRHALRHNADDYEYQRYPMNKEREIEFLKMDAADLEIALKRTQERLVKLQEEK